jgi:hypothetical protein
MDSLSDGVTHLTLDGKAEVTDTSEDGERYAPGMKTGLKHLYSGTEDKQGHFQWQDTIQRTLERQQRTMALPNGLCWCVISRFTMIHGECSRYTLVSLLT